MSDSDIQAFAPSHTSLSCIETIGLIGSPVVHSLSPAIQNAAATSLSIPWQYVAIDCWDDEAARDVIVRSKEANFVGMNITTPYKEVAAAMADELDTSAKRAGGANVLCYADGKLKGYSTDGAGVVGALSWQAGTDVEGTTCLVCGTGPAARSVVLALLDAKCSALFLASRNQNRSADLVRAIDDERIVPLDYQNIAETMHLCDVIVDATTVGMDNPAESVLPAEGFDAQHVLLDLVYAHGTTGIVAAAKAAGARAFDGLGMLVEQGALSFEIWAAAQGFGDVKVSRTLMMQAAQAELAHRSQNEQANKGSF